MTKGLLSKGQEGQDIKMFEDLYDVQYVGCLK